MAAPVPSPWPPTRYYAGSVMCPSKLAPANILAAAWKTRDRGWTPWYVVDCPLLPAGCITCDSRCLKQLVEPGKRSAPADA